MHQQQLKDLMSRDVKVISPDMTIDEAARTMRDGDFGMLPVGENDRMIGAVSDRDIAIRAVAEGKGPGTKVREIMSAGICWAYEDDTVDRRGEDHEREAGPPFAGRESRQASGWHRCARRLRGRQFRDSAGRRSTGEDIGAVVTLARAGPRRTKSPTTRRKPAGAAASALPRTLKARSRPSDTTLQRHLVVLR